MPYDATNEDNNSKHDSVRSIITHKLNVYFSFHYHFKHSINCLFILYLLIFDLFCSPLAINLCCRDLIFYTIKRA